MDPTREAARAHSRHSIPGVHRRAPPAARGSARGKWHFVRVAISAPQFRITPRSDATSRCKCRRLHQLS
eukprot:scaffold43941_cov33-Tisochrysis_lutea.AAC.5